MEKSEIHGLNLDSYQYENQGKANLQRLNSLKILINQLIDSKF